MREGYVRRELAKKVARRYAADLLADSEIVAGAFDEDELTAEERLEAHAELRRIAAGLRAKIDYSTS